MISALFESLTNALQAAPAIALGASFIWGILSILLSPCHLASIPLIVGFIDDQGKISTKRAFLLSLLFFYRYSFDNHHNWYYYSNDGADAGRYRQMG